MKQFLLRIFFFIVPIIVLAYPFDLGLSYLLRRASQYPGECEVWNDIYAHKAGCDIAIYGSSRAWVQFDSQIFSDSLHKSVYNFGIDGHNFWIQYLRHVEFLKYNNAPRMIILSVEGFSLQKRKDLYHLDQFLPYILWNQNMEQYTSSYQGFSKYDYYVPLLRFSGKYRTLTAALKNQSDQPYRNKGYKGMEMSWGSELNRAKEAQKKYNIKIDPQTVHLLDVFIRECKKNGIALVLVYAPEYIEGRNFISNRDEVVKIYKNFSTKYRLQFYDYSNSEICLNKNLFYNSMHLNKSGATIFSKNLAHKLKNVVDSLHLTPAAHSMLPCHSL